FVNSNNIKLQDIFPDAGYNLTLYKIDKNRYSKKVKTKSLRKLLSSHGYDSLESSSKYTKFIKRSPISLTFIEDSIRNAYKQKYQNIRIDSIQIIPRGYIKSLPLKYNVRMPKKYFLSKKGVLSIKTLENKKIFFDYLIDAKIIVYTSRTNIKKATKLSAFNLTKTSLQLDRLKALPMTLEQQNITQAKRNIKINTILTNKDIRALYLVKKGSHVIVSIDNKNITISFSAKALQSGKLHDIITVQKNNMKRLRVKIIGRNQVKMK
ncbi:MAG: flagellar basal body P-ring formation protein FlgA, partial [Sulfurimonas sp.]|nr:flagellar basal body P-ring formation protein FlgA [Sulfurimonas sp.]